jgi:hypothetical protein
MSKKTHIPDLPLRRYAMHNESQARYSLVQLNRDRHYKLIDEATYREVLARIEQRWPQLKHSGGDDQDEPFHQLD